ncbi:Transmembrane protein [Trichinella nativa]|uniref:Transmembrane protein n=1 Tax=Trichinella nativa TaxID=6335 RepID=A0A0V1LQ58_9BILA|nr:Transmembrane protein [Trichinella nativa]
MLKQISLIIFTIYFGSLSSAQTYDDCQGVFIQTGERLEYFSSASPLNEALLLNFNDESFHTPMLSDESLAVEKRASVKKLTIDPPSLDFGSNPVGIAKRVKVTLHNPLQNAVVRMDAISGSTAHFHCSFFDEKFLKAGSSTAFEVVFLPRKEGLIKTTLHIHSSAETIIYNVTGEGVPSPFRLMPFLGVKVSLNSSVSSWLELYNPFPTALHVQEMYTSDSSVHLDLPHSVFNPSRRLWNVLPFRTKHIATAKVIGNRVRNASAFIRLKTDNPTVQHPIIIPVEIEVTSQPGLYAGKSVVNFGLLSNEHRSPWNTITVYNTFNKPVKVTNVAVDDPCLFVRFKHTIVASNHHKDTLIAKIAYDPKVAILDQRRYRSGSVKFFDDNKVLLLSVPYRVEVLKGQLIFNSDQLAFFTGFNNSHERVVNLTSTFPETIAIYQLSLHYQLQKYLTVYNLTKPILLKPNSTMPVLTLKFLPQYNQKRTKASTLLSNVYLYTNLTKFAIPVRLFSGLLELTVLSSNGDVGELNFGQLNVGEKRSMFIRLANLNPLPVKLLRVTQDDVHNVALELLAVDTVRPKSTVEPFLPNHILDRWTENEELVLPAESFAFYKCTISAPARLLSMKSHLTFETEFQKLNVDIKYTVEKESKVSVPGTIILDNCFPGKISGRSIKVFSKLHHEVSNVRVYLDEKDAGFSLTPFSQGAVKIKPFQFTRLARLLFTPSNLCVEDECYVGFPLDTVDGLLWVKGLKLPANLAELDFVLFSKHWSLWTDMVEEKMTRMNTTVHLEAPSLKRISFPAQANLIWPRLIKQDIVYFPLTAVGNFSVVNLLLRNPSNHPIAVQIIPLAIYPNPSHLLNSLNGFVEIDDVLMFSLRDSELYNPTESSPVPEYRKQLEKIVGISIPRFTLSFLLKPGAKLSAQLGFLPSDYQLRSSLLAIRNNLTGMEMVTMYGRGAKLELKIGNVLPQSNNLLMFEIQDRHLFDCETMQRLNRRFSSTFSVSRSLVARNSGELPLHVTNISINGHQCQNRGFRIVNCAPFTLEPNETRPFEIVFRPDFTMYWYDAQLQLTIQGYHYPLLYKLGASVPKEWIVRCYSALPRPSWEQLLYYCSVIALGFLMICVVASAYLEGDRSITCAFRRRQLAENRKLFDLNAPMLCDSQQHPNDSTGGGNFVPQFGTNHQATLLVQLKQGVVVWLGKSFGWTKWFRASAKVEQQQLCPTPATGEATVPQPKSVRKMVKNVDSGKCSTELHLKNGRFTTTRTTKPKQKKYLESASSGKNVDRTSTNHHAVRINPVENEQVEVEKSITKKSKKQQHAVDRKQSSNSKFEEATTVAVEEKAGEQQQQQQQQQQHWNDNLHRETEEDWSHVTESSVSSDVVVVVAPQPCCPLELERLSSKEESSNFGSSPDQLEESNSVPEWDIDDDDAGGDEDDDIGGLSKTIDFDAEFEKLAEQTKAFSLIDKEAPVDSGDRWQSKMRQRRRQSHRQRCRASGSGPRRLSCSDSGSSSRATSRSDSPPAPAPLTDQLVSSGRSSATQSTTTAVSRPTVERNVRHGRKINENLKTVVELPFHYNREETSITKAAPAPMVTATTTITPPPTAATGVHFQSTNVHHFGTRTFGTFPPPSSAQPFYMQAGGNPLEISAVKKSEDWAGFELAPVIENLWDEDYEPWKQGNSSNLWNNDITSTSVNYPQQQQQQNSSATVSGVHKHPLGLIQSPQRTTWPAASDPLSSRPLLDRATAALVLRYGQTTWAWLRHQIHNNSLFQESSNSGDVSRNTIFPEHENSSDVWANVFVTEYRIFLQSELCLLNHAVQYVHTAVRFCALVVGQIQQERRVLEEHVVFFQHATFCERPPICGFD